MGIVLQFVAALLGASALFAGAVVLSPRPRAAPPPAEAVEVGPATEAPPEAAPVAVEPAPDAASARDGDAAAAEPPRFDVVRVEPDGTGLVAGRAEPGARVAVLAEGEVAAEAQADAEGRFVAFLALPPSSAPRSLSLEGENGPGAETVILAPVPSAPSAAAPSVTTPGVAAAVAPSPVPATAPRPGDLGAATGGGSPDADAASPEAPRVTAAPVAGSPGPASPGLEDGRPRPGVPEASASEPPGLPTPVEEAAPLADAAPGRPSPTDEAPAQPPVLLSDADGVRVVQPALAPGLDREALATVALDAIAYDGAGAVTLSGRAVEADEEGGAVRVYLDNAAVAEVAVDAGGGWTAPLDDAQPGLYTLRVDEVDAAGRVVSRIEMPFLREERADVAAALGEAARGARVAVRTVQPGNTLWAIARDRYDEPMMYMRVFEANRDRIRDPDLIYPGQVFVLPDL